MRLLEPVLLLPLHHGPAHGYTLLDQLGEFGLGDMDPSVVYRALREMESREWLNSAWDEEGTHGPLRRVYTLAPLGDEVLRSWVQDMGRTREMIDHVITVYKRHMESADDDHVGCAEDVGDAEKRAGV